MFSVHVLGCDDVVAGLGDVAHRVFHGGRAGRDGQARGAAFEGRDAVFEHALGGVGQTAVDVARVRQSEAGLGVVEVVEDVGGGLVDRHFLLFSAMVFSLVVLGREDFSLPPACRVRAVGEVLVMKLRRLGRTAQAERYRTCL